MNDASTRRQWLAGILGLIGVTGRAWAAAGEEEQIAAVSRFASEVGLGPLRVSRSAHFVGIGDAPDGFRAEALEVCEAFSRVFTPYFQEHGLGSPPSTERLLLVILKDADSYQRFARDEAGPAVGGHYDRDTNLLVVFDFRSQRDQLAAAAERVNTYTLIHETAHLLSFNRGILDRKADVPVAVSEGLATYMELWRPRGRDRFGSINRPRLKALRQAGDRAESWIELKDLLTRDAAFEQEQTEQLAYAESWLFMHMLLRDTSRQKALKSYLTGMPREASAEKRMEHLARTLGPVSDLERELKRHARRELASL